MNIPNTIFKKTKDGVSISGMWTADGALQFSQDVSDRPETPGSPDKGWVREAVCVLYIWLETYSNFRFVQSPKKWIEQSSTRNCIACNYLRYFHVKEINEWRGIMTERTNKWRWKRITENEEKYRLESLYNTTRIFHWIFYVVTAVQNVKVKLFLCLLNTTLSRVVGVWVQFHGHAFWVCALDRV